MDNNTLKARHKELTVDTSLLICTLEVPKSCTAVHSSRLLRAVFEKGAAPPAVPNPAADAAPAAAAPAAAPALIYYPRCIEHISFSVITVRSASAT